MKRRLGNWLVKLTLCAHNGSELGTLILSNSAVVATAKRLS